MKVCSIVKWSPANDYSFNMRLQNLNSYKNLATSDFAFLKSAVDL
jgi:hypothetical protein